MKKLYLTLLMLFFVPFFVIAETGQGLTISPPIKEVEAGRGEIILETIRVTNPTENVIEVYPKVMDFKAKGDGGEPAFYEGGDSNEKFSLGKWISFSDSKLALAPEQVVEFRYQINVPEDAEPGGHYGAVFFASNSEVSDDNVALNSMIGSLLLVKVPGEVVEKGQIEDFYTNKALYLRGPVNFLTRIKNNGNIHFKPKGNIVIKDFSGREISRLTFNEQGGNVLPDSTRKFDNILGTKAFQFGKFSADLDLTYGDNKETLKAETTFWLIPTWLIVIVVLTIVLLTFVFISLFKSIKKKKTKKESLNSGKILLR